MNTSFWNKLSTGMLGATVLAVGTTVAAPSQATTLTGFQTFGDKMAGMEVTVDFVGGGSQIATWNATGSGAGGALGTDWSLTQSGDTFENPWTLNVSKAITSLVINAIPGNTVFDKTDPSPGTPGSFAGHTFSVVSGQAPTSFDYSVPIDISVGDIFGKLTLNWTDGFSGRLTYFADTDSGNTIDPVKPKDVPEPSSMLALLAVCGTVASSSLLKRRQQHKA